MNSQQPSSTSLMYSGANPMNRIIKSAAINSLQQDVMMPLLEKSKKATPEGVKTITHMVTALSRIESILHHDSFAIDELTSKVRELDAIVASQKQELITLRAKTKELSDLATKVMTDAIENDNYFLSRFGELE